MVVYFVLGLIAVLIVVGIAIYLATPRSYESSSTVANSYDQ